MLDSPIGKKTFQPNKNQFKNILEYSKGKVNLAETDVEKEFANKIDWFLMKTILEELVIILQKGALFAGRFNRTIRDLRKKLVLEKRNANWMDKMNSVTKSYSITKDCSIKSALIQASFKKSGDKFRQIYRTKKENETEVYIIGFSLDCRQTKFHSKGDTTNWIYELYTIREIINDRVPTHQKFNLPERYNEALLQISNLPM